MLNTVLKGSRLSLQQARLWAIQRESKAYRVQCTILLEGQLDISILQQALQQLVIKHEILRSVLYHIPGVDVPLLAVNETDQLFCPEIHLEDMSLTNQEAQVEKLFQMALEEPFDLTIAPLLRTWLLHLAVDKHILLISLPALCADASTLQLFVTKLCQEYAALSEENVLTDETLQYADISAWLNDLLQDEDAIESHTYWSNIDLSQRETLPLPPDADRQASISFAPQSIELQVDALLSTSLHEQAQRTGISAEAWVLVCWRLLLWRLTNEPRVLTGVACDGRHYEELANALGLCSRFIPLRTLLIEDESFEAIAIEVNKALDEAREEQEYFTWDRLAQATSSPTDLPFFPLSFQWQDWPETLHAAGLRFSLLRSWDCYEPFALKLQALSIGQNLRLLLHADPTLLTPSHLQHLGSALLCLLQTSLAHPQYLLGQFPLLSPPQQDHLLQRLHGPARALPGSTIAQLFAQQARLHPQRPALVWGTTQFSYQQLDALSNQLAHTLRHQGVHANVLVALCMPRSADLLIALLAVLKAGGAYLPLDPDLPLARLEHQWRQSQPHLLLTQEALRDTLTSFPGHTLCLDAWMPSPLTASAEALAPPAGEPAPQDLAYVMYTSGSTGGPKGVMVSQQSLLNYTLALNAQLGVQPGWHYGTVSTLSADLGNTAIFPALTSGGCLHVVPYEQLTDGQAFADSLQVQPLDVLKITPSHLAALLATSPQHSVLPTRWLILGGEALPRPLLQQIQRRGGSCQVLNHYGPTEATVGALVHPLGQAQTLDLSNHPIALGRPIANMACCVLDACQHPLPVGFIGELYLAGVGLALGYLGQPEQTQARFLPHPWQPGERLYRTGDLAYVNEEGNVVFVGRADQQVKLRGYRIELQEIEEALREHEQIQEAVVVLRKNETGEPGLVGYVVSRQARWLDGEEVRAYLRTRLPEYMIPTNIVSLPALPLTHNGKVDRQRLPEPEQVVPALRKQEGRPHSPLEEGLLALWEELLAVRPIQVYEDFFALGGHSLLAMRLIGQVRQSFGVEIPILKLFEAPTVAQFARVLQQALQKDDEAELPVLEVGERHAAPPLSFAQQRLWFLNQLQPDSSAYHLSSAVRLKGTLQIHAFEQALDTLVRRHESLRTSFQMLQGSPVQIIAAPRGIGLRHVGLQDLDAAQQEPLVKHLTQQETLALFDLQQGPLIRAVVLHLSEEEHILCLSMHHIVSDGWSSEILLREVRILYTAYAAGEPSPLPDLPIQYADYALWQRRWLVGAVLTRQLAYWQEHLAQLEPLVLPTDAPRPIEQHYHGALVTFDLPDSLAKALTALSQRAGVTSFMTLLASFQILLARWSGQDDIAVGTPIANRTRSQIEGLIGFFANTLVLRTDLSGNPDFEQVLQRVREVCLGAYAHQDLPFEHLVEELHPQRDLSRSPLFQVLFVLQQTATLTPELATGVTIDPLPIPQRTAKFDLTWGLEITPQSWHGWVEYNTDLFTEHTIQRWVQHWQTLLHHCVHQPKMPISNLSLLSDQERKQLLLDWNATQVSYPPASSSLHALIEAQVARCPDAIALSFDGHFLSYEHLNRRANQLARHLREAGVGPEVPVGVCLPRCLDLVLCLLAILKAGGAYVPLDPSYPTQRLAFLLEDAAVPVLLTSQQLSLSLPQSGQHVLLLEEVHATLSSYDQTNPEWPLHPENLAYLIYTSGSTGQPKGAMNSHRAICNRLLWMQDTYHLSSLDRVVQKTPFSFDVSVWEFFWPLLTGAHLVLALPEGHRDPHYLSLLVREEAITTIHFVPSMLQVFLQEPTLSQQDHSLQRLICSGEALSTDLQERCRSLLGLSVEISNLYGPTEAAVDVTAWIAQPTNDGEVLVPIGRPIANIQIYLLDRWMQPVPIGVPGELYIGGVGVGRGYWQRATLTAERFVPDPFASQGGGRLYRTGDLACYRAEGRIEYQGRIDEQVKLRGYRIELGEIEAVLAEHPAVSSSLVLLREDETHNPCLVAYIVANASEEFVLSNLRTYLQRNLPEYMVPTYFMQLEALPLTPNGKIDRKALPVPQRHSNQEKEQDQRSRTPFEEIVAQVWCEVLSLQQVGIHEDFFALGGHSLLATQVIGRLRALLHVDLPLRSIFEAPTITGLTTCIEETLRSQSGMVHPVLEVGERHAAPPLSFAQQRLWFLNQLQPDSSAYHLSSAICLKGTLQIHAFEQALDTLVRRHESLRTSFQMLQGSPVQIIAAPRGIGLRHVGLQDLDAAQQEPLVKHLTQQETLALFDLQQGPLIRAVVLHLSEEEHILCLSMHHIVSDGWSSEILLREVRILYTAYAAGGPSPLPDLPIQYADYALWQRRWLVGDVLTRQLAYWQERLEGITPLELPTDHPHLPLQTFNGAIQILQLPRSLCKKLIALSQQEHVTLFMLLLAAFQILLARYSGQEDICTGTAIANRTQPELEGVVGFFANMLVLRTDLSGNPDFIEVLRRVREVALGAYSHQDIPFEQLVEAIQFERDLSRHPLFQAAFQLLQKEEDMKQLEELTLSELDTGHITTKFEITLTVLDTAQDFQCIVEYNTDLFEANTIRLLLEHWQTLLEEVVSRPQCTLAELSFLTAAERYCLLTGWNATRTNFPRHASLNKLFSEQAKLSPDAIAVVCDDHHLSYEALEQTAQRLAYELSMHGLQLQSPVAVCLPRSIMGIIAILGLLQAGGVFVPLDPTWPAERMALLIEETQAALILTSQAFAERFTQMPISIVNLDQQWEKIAHHPTISPQRTLPAEALAYIIYTSGSTGKPKGVMVPHSSILNRLQWGIADVNLQSGDRIGQVASWSFDIALWELFGPWLVGARCVIISADEVRDVRALARRIDEENITVQHAVPSLLAALLQEPDFAKNRSVRSIQTGGEVVSAELVRRTLAVKGASVHQFYGPTEASISVTGWKNEPEQGNKHVTLGGPIANTKIYLIDRWGGLVAPGMRGELWIGGENLAWGYWQQGGWTAERFVPDPFSEEPGARLYRTGDIGKYLPEGEIEFVGRIDEQVKIRGYRIEPGEIEAVLQRYPAIHECVVLTREKQTGEKFLVAYVVGKQIEKPLQERKLKEYLQERLPGYMIPEYLMILDKLPVTVNGKVDRRALPDPESLQDSEDEQNEPRTPIEELLLQLWRTILGREDIGIYDDFFSMGGHSLLATRLVSRAQAILNANIQVTDLFEASTVADFAERIEETLYEETSRDKPPLLSVTRMQELPLSFAQQRLWFLDQLEPNSAAYTIPAALRIHGNLHIEALEQSLNEIVRRHESLRTCFPIHGDQPVQVIMPAQESVLRHIILKDLAMLEREEQAYRLIRQEASRPFDLQHEPLLRLTILYIDKDEHILCLSLHHIVSDGWSAGIFVRELYTLYAAYKAGQSSPLPETSIQYADYAVWQRSWLRDEVLEQQLAYWRHQLEGITPLELPTDHPRPLIQRSVGQVERIILPTNLSEELKALSQREGTTLFMTLLAAFKVLLLRYSGQTDIAVGTLVANRNQAEVENIIGFFVNTLVLRTNLAGNPTFHELLKRVRDVALGAYTHQDIPFEKLVEALQPERDLSHSPLFQVLFTFQTMDPLPQEMSGLALSNIEVESSTAKFDLGMTVTNQGHSIQCTIEYNTDLFDQSTIKEMLRHWQILLEATTRQENLRISALPILNEETLTQLLRTWNATRAVYPHNVCIHHLFEEQVKRTPDAVAVTLDDTHLTYRTLNEKANSLAHYLRAHGVKTGSMVAIFQERSLLMTISILAILKSGGAYVPLDPHYPRERLEYMLKDIRSVALLTQQKLLHEVPTFPGLQVICVDAENATALRGKHENGNYGIHAESVVYTIYTSGSTGQPKGVMITHKALVSYTLAITQQFHLQTSDRFLQFASLSFDVSVEEMFPTWICGATLVLCQEQRLISPSGLAQIIDHENITIMELPTAYWHEWVLEILRTKTALPDFLRAVIIGGEHVLPERLTAWQQFDIALIHVYGLTEVTVTSTVYTYQQHTSQPQGRSTFPIGYPIANTRLYVLDTYQQPVPVGIPGELYIGGDNLALGYFNRPALTATRFVPDPFMNEPGSRLYKTGDMVRYLPNGTLDFLGRMDHQIKLRGFRIELGEIESTLVEYPNVDEAAVVVWESTPGNKILVGYIVITHGKMVLPHSIRAFLQQRLPDYMIPAVFINLDTLPLSPNGKLDRRALPAPDQGTELAGRRLISPRTPIEEILQNIWAEVLGRADISINDNFFAIGGHSLLVTQLVSRVNAHFQLNMPIRCVFEAPTLASQAEQVQLLRQGEYGIAIPPPVPAARGEELPLSFAQQRLWFLHQLDPENVSYNISLAVSLEGGLHLHALEHSFDEIVRRHESLRTTFYVHNGQPHQLIRPASGSGLRHIDLRGLSGPQRVQQANRVEMQEGMQPFDFQQGPLIRFILLRLDDQHYHLLVNMHHIVADGWSTDLLGRELNTLYRAFSMGAPSPLADLPIQYADYAIWQRSWFSGEVLKQHLDYWKNQLAGARPLQLPAEGPRSQRGNAQGTLLHFQVPASISQDLLALSRQEGVTLFMTLLSAFQTLLYRWSGQIDVLVGTDFANRNQLETEALIGFFINLLALRTQVRGTLPFRKLLAEVRETVLEAYQYAEMPFEMLIEHLQVERNGEQTPLVKVLLVLQNLPGETVTSLPEIHVQPLEGKTPNAKFDLAVFLSEHDGGLSGSVTYRKDLFSARTIDLLMQRFVILLHSIVADRETPLDLLQFYTEAEQEQSRSEKQKHRKTKRDDLKMAKRDSINLTETDSQ